MTKFDDKAKESIRVRLEEIAAQKAEIQKTVREHPEFVEKFLERDRAKTITGLDALDPVLSELIAQVKKVRKHVPDITDRTRNAACYILFGKVVKTIRACNALARGGYYQELMELARSVAETQDLIQLFIIEGDGGPNLEKWFDGSIVDNGVARKAIGADFDKYKEKALTEIAIATGDYEKAKVENHRMLSKFNHSSYAALLDSYDRVNDDLDYKDLAGYHFAQTTGILQIKLMIEATFVALRYFYYAIADNEGFEGLTAIMDSLLDISSEERLAQAKAVAEKFSADNT